MEQTRALAIPSAGLPTPMGSLEAYIARITQFPVLSAEEERSLAYRLRDQGDILAAQKLVLSNLRFVVHIARGYRGYGLPQADLIQEGNIGLMKAVRRYNPDLGVRLVSFAVHWIKAEIHEFILRNWRIVKVATTKAQRKLFFNLRSAKKRLGWLNQEEVDSVAQDLGVPAETVMEMESRLSGQDVAFDAEPSEDGEEENFAPAAYLADHAADPATALEELDWENHGQQALQQALASLDQRSRDIILRRWAQEDKSTLQDLAVEYGVSAERIRQLENNALRKLKQQLAAAA